MLKSGERQFTCNKCECAASVTKPSRDIGLTDSPGPKRAASPQVSATHPDDLEEEQVPLRALLVRALEGISFLTDQVSQLKLENERMRREAAAKAEAQAAAVKSLRHELHSLRSELAGSTPLPILAAPTSTPVWPSQPTAPGSAAADAPPSPPSASERLPPAVDKKRRSPACVGASDSSALVVVQQPRRSRAMFVSKLSPATTSASLTTHLSTLGITPSSCRRLKTKFDSYASFYISVNDESFERLSDPAVWPRGCLFKEFQGIFRDSMLHTSERMNEDSNVE